MKIFKKIINVVCWILVACICVAMLTSMITQINGGSISLFGYTIYRVTTGSMEPELMVGDVIVGQRLDDYSRLQVDDVIVFDGIGELSGKLVTHKVIKAPFSDDGVLKVQTKGVANTEADSPIPVDNIRGLIICKAPLLTRFYEFFFSPWGLIAIIVLLIIIFIDEIIHIWRVMTNRYDEEEPESVNDIIERISKENKEQ